jgi:hypothetical protein
MTLERGVGVAAILKDEGPYLLEWIAYYRVLGVQHFFLADNGGRDNTSDLLSRLDEAGIVSRIHWPTPQHGNSQLSAYKRILKRRGRKVDWLAIVDGDEFIRLEPPFRTLPDFIEAVAGDAGAIALNWAVYGSSGLAQNDLRLVTERFTMRSEQQWAVNRHLKSIVRPGLVSRPLNPHVFELLPGVRTVDSTGHPLVMPEDTRGRSAEVVWGGARVQHYVVKSRAEFEIKRTRGRADSKLSRDEEFFKEHDRNDVHDPMPAELVEATRLEVARLERLLRGSPAAVLLRAWRAFRRRAALRAG